MTVLNLSPSVVRKFNWLPQCKRGETKSTRLNIERFVFAFWCEYKQPEPDKRSALLSNLHTKFSLPGSLVLTVLSLSITLNNLKKSLFNTTIWRKDVSMNQSLCFVDKDKVLHLHMPHFNYTFSFHNIKQLEEVPF